MNNMTLEVHGLAKTFGTGDAKTDVLKGIDFSASSGELIILSGASGSGSRPYCRYSAAYCPTLKERSS